MVMLAVALRKESVDRNIISLPFGKSIALVALRKESVDRNLDGICHGFHCIMSLSARRAWIEIAVGRSANNQQYVALRKESVDRNFSTNTSSKLSSSRSPQGERG